MKSYKQTLMTVFVVFATAYVLTLMGCAKSKDVSGPPPAAQPQTETPQTDLPREPEAPSQNNPASNLTPKPDALKEIPFSDLRECTSDEFSALVKWSDDLSASNTAIADSGGRKNDVTVQLALKAIQSCDEAQSYHALKPCKRTTRVVTDPDHPLVRGYDAARIQKRCEATENYLQKFKIRPDPSQSRAQPEPVVPPQPKAPPAVAQPPVNNDQVSQCSIDEFTKLNAWRASLDLANKNIAKLGSPANWKYDVNAIDSAKTATVACETLIAYHDSRPCKREKTYTGASLREQCSTARTYYYDFAQRTQTLITPGASLYFKTAVLANKIYNPGPAGAAYGQCVITNQSNSVIAYNGQNVLVTEARVNTEADLQMFVFVTQEGLKLECYGVDYQSAATSLREVMKLLDAKGTKLNLSYKLN